MTLTRFCRALVAVVALVFANIAVSQPFPVRPIRIITGEPGSGPDVSARVIAQAISGPLGQQVYIENHAGIMVGEIVAKSAPDGYTLLQNGSAHWLAPFSQAKLAWDPVKDFAPITITDRSPNVLVVQPGFPAKSVAELITLAKAEPGKLNFSQGPPGGPPHLSAELFKQMAKVDIVAVPYKGGGPAVIGLLGGQVQMMFAPASAVAQHIKAGRLRALAVTSAQPSILLPDLPTIAASGLPGYESSATFGLFAPAGTPATVVARLNQEVVNALKRPEIRQNFINAGVEPIGSSPEEFAAVIKAEMAKAGQLMRRASSETK